MPTSVRNLSQEEVKGRQRFPPPPPPFYRKGAQGVKEVLFVPEQKVLEVELKGRERLDSHF